MIEIVGWLGVFWGLLVGPAQLWKIFKTHKVEGISKLTYTFLCLALICYLIYAISIKDAVFITAQALNLGVNLIILILLVVGIYG